MREIILIYWLLFLILVLINNIVSKEIVEVISFNIVIIFIFLFNNSYEKNRIYIGILEKIIDVKVGLI